MGLTSVQDVKTKAFWAAALAELLGTMFLVFVACGSCSNFVKQSRDQPRDQIVQISLAFGLSVATIVWIIARVSGGHINPAVTVGFLVTRKITVLRALIYILSQCLGSLIGAFLLYMVTPSGVNAGLGTSTPGKDVTAAQIFLIELLISFVLVWTVFGTCDPLRKDLGGSGPLAIGLSITMCHLFAVPYTGSGMNPARVLGPAIVSKFIDFSFWPYMAGPLAGGVAAALLYDFVLAVNSTSDKLRGFLSKDYDDSQYDEGGRKRDFNNEECIQLKGGVKSRV